MTFQLVPIKSIPVQLHKAVTLKLNVTISALFHGLVSSNVSFTSGMKKEDAADFDTVLRHLLPIKYDAKSEGYQFEGKKAFKSAEKLEINLEIMRADFKDGDKEKRNEIIFAFYDAAMNYYKTNSAAKKADDLDSDTKRNNALNRIKASIKAAKDNGATDRDIVQMLIGAGINVRESLEVPANDDADESMMFEDDIPLIPAVV